MNGSSFFHLAYEYPTPVHVGTFVVRGSHPSTFSVIVVHFFSQTFLFGGGFIILCLARDCCTSAVHKRMTMTVGSQAADLERLLLVLFAHFKASIILQGKEMDTEYIRVAL